MEHIFENNELGLQFTGKNLSEVGDFLSDLHYEYNGSGFVIPSPSGDVVVMPGDWIVKRANGTIGVLPPTAPADEVFPVKPKAKKRGNAK